MLSFVDAIIAWCRENPAIASLLLGVIVFLTQGVKNCINACLKVVYFLAEKIKDKKAKREYFNLYRCPQKACEHEHWLYFPHEDAPRLPVCPRCTRPGVPVHMEKIKNTQYCRKWPVKWSYHCNKCNDTHIVECCDSKELMNRLGEHWP